MRESTSGLGGHEGPLGLAPTALEIAVQAGLLTQLADYYRQQDNPLMHAISLVCASADG